MLDLERLNIDAEASFEDVNNLLYRLGGYGRPARGAADR